MQKENKASITLSLRQEIEREAQKIEEEIAKHPELEQVQVTEEMDQAFWEKIRAYEREVEEERQVAEMAEAKMAEAKTGEKIEPFETHGPHGAGEVEFSEELVPDMSEWGAQVQRGEDEKGKKVYRKKKKKYWVVSLAAVLVIVLGFGMNSVGSKAYWKNLWEIFVGKEPVNFVDVEDMDKQNSEDVDEIAVYKEIKEKLNIVPARLIYKPDGMELVDYEIQEEILTAKLLYKHQDEVVKYALYVSDIDSSWGEKEGDIKMDEYKVYVNNIEISIEEFQVKNNVENRQVASFEYEGAYYQLKGIMQRDEFKKILENLYFF